MKFDLRFRGRPCRIWREPWGEGDPYVVIQFEDHLQISIAARAELY